MAVGAALQLAHPCLVTSSHLSTTPPITLISAPHLSSPSCPHPHPLTHRSAALSPAGSARAASSATARKATTTTSIRTRDPIRCHGTAAARAATGEGVGVGVGAGAGGADPPRRRAGHGSGVNKSADACWGLCCGSGVARPGWQMHRALVMQANADRRCYRHSHPSVSCMFSVTSRHDIHSPT